MPNVLLHTLLADRVLARWRSAGLSPFDASDARCRAAFVHGALGPDLGYFPGGDALLSEVLHRLRTGRMVERLLAHARQEREVAFACGWITHFLADVRIHPIVDVEAARIVFGEPPGDRPQGDAMALLHAHIRVEVGLDGAFLARYPEIGRRLPPVLDAEGMTFLAAALRDVYGMVIARHELAATHHSIAHWHRCLVPLVRWMTADWVEERDGAGRVVAPLLRSREGSWVRYIGAGPTAAAFVSPVRPRRSLVDRMEQEIDALADSVDEALRMPSALVDLDMEDGRAITEAEPKAATANTLAALSRRVRRGGAPRYSETPRKPTTKAMVMSPIRSTP